MLAEKAFKFSGVYADRGGDLFQKATNIGATNKIVVTLVIGIEDRVVFLARPAFRENEDSGINRVADERPVDELDLAGFDICGVNPRRDLIVIGVTTRK